MSSEEIPDGEAVGASVGYFCYQCEAFINITPPSSPTAELVCPNCEGGFLEESFAPPPLNPDDPLPNPLDEDFGLPTPGSAAFSFSSGSGSGEFEDISSLFGARSPDEFNPFVFLNNFLNNLQERGATIQLVIESPGGGVMGGGGADFVLPTNLGDYFIGPGLEQLIQHLGENDPNRYGTPPASKSAVEGLPDVSITEQMLASDNSQCAVCKDSFELNEVAKQMPCKHIYHKDCILPWLEMHNSCPVCRYELPTDDPDYENRRTGQMNDNSSRNSLSSNLGLEIGIGGLENNNNNNDSDNNNNSPQTTGTVETRFRISLPWLFGGSGSQAETSNSGGESESNDGGNNNTNQGNNNGAGSGGRGGRRTREEDLD